MNVTKAKLDGLFADELALLQPTPGYMTQASSNSGNGSKGLVDLICASSNPLISWLRQIDALRARFNKTASSRRRRLDAVEKKAKWHESGRGITAHSALHDLEMLHARFIEHRFTRHSHDYYVIGVVEAGVQAYSCRGARHVTPAGQIFLVNPGEPHTGEAATHGGYVYRTVYPRACTDAANCRRNHRSHRVAASSLMQSFVMRVYANASFASIAPWPRAPRACQSNRP